jgi:hypothetical protein
MMLQMLRIMNSSVTNVSTLQLTQIIVVFTPDYCQMRPYRGVAVRRPNQYATSEPPKPVQHRQARPCFLTHTSRQPQVTVRRNSRSMANETEF